MSEGGLQKKGDYHSTCFWGGSEFEFCNREGSIQGAPVCWGFWAWGPGFLTVSWS
jgi:hypothetical protein